MNSDESQTSNDTQSAAHPYAQLVPECILDAVESTGLRATGALMALNSYENRVYRVDIEGETPVAAKFYRPNRWSQAQILEEHRFSRELAEHEIPALAPLPLKTRDLDSTLGHHQGFMFALFAWQPGRTVELTSDEHYRILGRYLGRLHALGAARPFTHRPTLDWQTFGTDSVQWLLSHGFIPEHLIEAYTSLTTQLLEQIRSLFENTDSRSNIRLHGDCHLSNLLWTDSGPHIVDFDDCRMGPAIQDLWMLLSGEPEDKIQQLGLLLDGYTRFHDFDVSQLALIEALRTLRLMHYSAWLGRRWQDPAFPHNFPWFNSTRYWEEHVLHLREQQALMNEPPLHWRREFV